MKYDAITLDTTIFYKNSFQFNRGMLDQLTQFKNGTIEFVLSDIVQREVQKALCNQAMEAHDAIDKAIKLSNKSGLLSTAAEMQKIYDGVKNPKDIANDRFREFISNTGAIIIGSSLASMDELLKLYFNAEPPFEETGRKKNEFPDAIALLSLESWAKSNTKKILVISEDAGWAAFAESSEWIDVEKDLALALQKLQKHAEQAERLVELLLRDLAEGKRESILNEITEAIEQSVLDMEVLPEATADYYYEADRVQLEYKNFKFICKNNRFDFKITQIGKDRIVAKIAILITIDAKCDFSFSTWDSVDKEYVGMGTGSAETEVEFREAILLTIEGDLTAEPPDIEISEIELIDKVRSVDFGEVGLDYDEDDYEEDPHDFHH